jgi:hypothetical protein
MVDQPNQPDTETPKPDIFSGISTGLQSIGMPKELADPQERILRDYRRASEEEAKAKAARTTSGLQAETKAAEGLAATQRQAMGAFQNLPPQPKFNVNKDTEEGLMGMAALLPIAGLLMGAKGQMSGVNAMNAMTGVMKGYQEGNQQRIAFETQKYEKATKEWEANYARVKDGFERAMALAKTDYNAAIAKAKETAASVGSAELSAMLDKETLSQVYNKVSQIGQEYIKSKQLVDRSALRAVDVFDASGQRLRVTEQEFRQDMTRPESERQYRLAPTGREPTPLKAVIDGKTVYVDRGGNPITDKEGKPIVAPETRTAAAETRYSFNVAESMGQAIQDLKNVQLLPRDSVLGTFAGLTGADARGVVEGLRNAFARRVTSEDNRLFEQMIGGLEANMARALGGGYASSTTAKNIEAYRSQVAREGDTAAAKAIFLARMRQELDTLADFFEQRPGAAPFVGTVKKYQQLLHDSVPFTVDDVIRARSNVESLPIGSEGAAQRGAGNAPAPAQMNTAEDVKSAFQAGRISREEATRILKEKFGYQ